MTKNERWVSFKAIKAKVTLDMVLKHYGVLEGLTPSGKNLVGCCPIHGGSNLRQFSANLERNIWNCFGDCKAGGNVLDFVAKMEKVSLHEAGQKLKNWFLVNDPLGEGNHTGPNEKTSPRASPGQILGGDELAREEKEGSEKEKANHPLKFFLQLEPEHPFFEERGITQDTVKAFGIGYCSRGLLKGRVAIPIHDEQGQLVAYCGRAVTPEQIDKEGKYKMPPNFHKQEVVYNLHRQATGTKALILVESFLSVFKLYQNDIPNVVSLMGSVLSEKQEALIVDLLGQGGNVILLFDSDEDGQKCTQDCLQRLGSKLFVKAIDLGPHARKPHQLAPEQINDILLF
jgi:DNA primase